MSRLSPRPTPKPWPMKWVVAAIAVFVAGYTLINLYYRKPGRGHRPYEEASQHVTAARLHDAGWERMPVDVRRPAEKPSAGEVAGIARGAVGLGLDLNACFTEPPPLLASIDEVTAPAVAEQGSAYTAYFTASVADLQLQLGEIQLFRNGNELVLIPNVEHLPGEQLLSRWHDSHYCATFSTQALAPGRYHVRLIAKGPAAMWNLTVK